MSGCYVLKSEKLRRFYVGATNDDVQQRLSKHNQGFYGKNKFTSTTDDWELVLFIPTDDYAHAIRTEQKIKSMKSSNYIRNLSLYPEMLQKLVSSTRLSR